MLDWNSEELKHIDTLINFIDEYDKIFTDNFKNKTIDEELEAGWTFGVMDCISKVLSGHFG